MTPVELPDGLVWRLDPDNDDWNVLDSFGELVGYVYYRRACEDYGARTVRDGYRSTRVGSPSEDPLDACRALADALQDALLKWSKKHGD